MFYIFHLARTAAAAFVSRDANALIMHVRRRQARRARVSVTSAGGMIFMLCNHDDVPDSVRVCVCVRRCSLPVTD